MPVYLIVFVALAISIVTSAIAIRCISKCSTDYEHSLEEAMRIHPAGKGLRSEEDILND